MPLKIRWFGAIGDSSGYANSSRNYIHSLSGYKDEIDLSVGRISFETEKTQHELTPLINSYVREDQQAKIQITHLTPENYEKFKNKHAYNIGYTAWETSVLPKDWPELCNQMDEIWVPSTWNVKVFKDSGVKKPIICIPHVVECEDISGIQPFDQKGENYWFYSIFQWTARKNPFALLMAYFTEFWNTDNVILAIKTYRKNTTSGEKQIIKNDIENIKRILGLPKYPPVLFYSNLMTSEEMKKLHKTGDCFVLPSKGEGWGIPFAEAMSFGNPVVGPNYGGNIDFMNETNSFLIETHEEPVHGMVWMPHYTGLMTWGNPDIMDLRKIMRYVFENKEEARKIGQKGKETIKDECNKEVIGRLMINRLNQIAKEKGL